MTNIQQISPIDAQAKLDAKQAILLDVREINEYEEWHINNSLLCPLSSFDAHEILAQLPSDRDIIVHCRSGKRSEQAIILLNQAGCDLLRLFNLDGGIIAWEQNNLDIVS